MNDPVVHLLVTGCHDCDRLTSGRCWRHSTTVIPIGHVQVIPSTITIVPEVVIVPPLLLPRST